MPGTACPAARRIARAPEARLAATRPGKGARAACSGHRDHHRDRLHLGGVLHSPGPASADPSADDWYQLRMCESTNRYDINTGNGYYGAYQFDLSDLAVRRRHRLSGSGHRRPSRTTGR